MAKTIKGKKIVPVKQNIIKVKGGKRTKVSRHKKSALN